MRNTHFTRVGLFFLGLVVLVGCGKSREIGDVTGIVTYKGEPVTGGELCFYSADGGLYSTGIRPDGHYTLSQVPAGEVTVTINTEELNPNKKTQTYDPKSAKSGAAGKYGGKSSAPPSVPKGGKGMKAEKSPAPEGSATGSPGIYVKIPKDYTDQTKSPLKVTVKSGKQELNLELKD